MIIDTIKNRDLYTVLSPWIKASLDYLGTTDFSKLEPGRYDIDGDNAFALVQEYQTIPREQGKWECHRKYIDIQYISEGMEQIGFGDTNKMEPLSEYDPDHDLAFLKGEGEFVTLTKGCFGIFFPSDAHQPKVAPGDLPGPVKKVVVKVLAV